MARVRRSDPGRDAGGVPVRLSQPQPLACALRPHHHRLAGVPRHAGRRRAVRSGDRVRHRAHLAVRGGDRRLRAGDLPLAAWLRPRRPADPDLAPAGGLDGRGRTCGAGLRDQRHHRPGAAGRPRADRHADRLYGHAARLRGRHHHRHRLRRRAPRAGADRRRRHDLGLGRLRRQGLHQPGNRDPARAQARHPGGAGGTLARRAASARPRPLPRRARQRARTAPRPADPGLPPAQPGRPLSLVHPQGAAGGGIGRRGRAARRHAHGRHRIQECRGAPAARRGARQPHRPAQPRTVHRPAGKRAGVRQGRPGDQAHRRGDRSRPFQAGQRSRSASRSAIPSCSPWRAGSDGCSSRRIRWRGFRAISSR